MIERRKERLQKITDCKTPQELAEQIFRSSGTYSNIYKQELLIEWIDCYKNNKPFIRFNHKTPEELAEDIYKTDWDESDGLFQSLRETLINWINNYKK